MDRRAVVIEIIRHDMLYCQYVKTLSKIGLKMSYEYDIEFFDMIAMVMDWRDEDIPYSVSDLYVKYLIRGARYKIVPMGENLYPLADECYEALIKRKRMNEVKTMKRRNINTKRI